MCCAVSSMCPQFVRRSISALTSSEMTSWSLADLPAASEGAVHGDEAERDVALRRRDGILDRELRLLRRDHRGVGGFAGLVLEQRELGWTAPRPSTPVSRLASASRDVENAERPSSTSCCAVSTVFW